MLGMRRRNTIRLLFRLAANGGNLVALPTHLAHLVSRNPTVPRQQPAVFNRPAGPNADGTESEAQFVEMGLRRRVLLIEAQGRLKLLLRMTRGTDKWRPPRTVAS